MLVLVLCLDCIPLLVSSGSDLYCESKEGLIPIQYAIRDDHLEAVEAILDSDGFDIHWVDFNNESLVHYAAVANNEAVLQMLIDRGAAVDGVDRLQRSPLHLSIMKHSEEAAFFLLDSGIDIEIKDMTGATALHFAVLYNVPTIAEELVKRGAVVDIMDYDRYTPLHHAVNIGELRDVAMLLRHGAIDWHTIPARSLKGRKGSATVEEKALQRWGSKYSDVKEVLAEIDRFSAIESILVAVERSAQRYYTGGGDEISPTGSKFIAKQQSLLVSIGSIDDLPHLLLHEILPCIVKMDT